MVRRASPVASTKALPADLDAKGKIPFLAITAAETRTKPTNIERKERVGGPRRLLRWQKRAFKQLADERLRISLAPMGSGNSTLVRALAVNDLRKGLKAIISYPQRAIARGFSKVELRLPDGTVRTWCPSAPPEEAKVDAIVKFVREPASANEAGRTLLCTHAE